MAYCVNINTKEYKQLKSNFPKISNAEFAADVALYQERNNGNYPNLEQITNFRANLTVNPKLPKFNVFPKNYKNVNRNILKESIFSTLEFKKVIHKYKGNYVMTLGFEEDRSNNNSIRNKNEKILKNLSNSYPFFMIEKTNATYKVYIDDNILESYMKDMESKDKQLSFDFYNNNTQEQYSPDYGYDERYEESILQPKSERDILIENKDRLKIFKKLLDSEINRLNSIDNKTEQDFIKINFLSEKRKRYKELEDAVLKLDDKNAIINFLTAELSGFEIRLAKNNKNIGISEVLYYLDLIEKWTSNADQLFLNENDLEDYNDSVANGVYKGITENNLAKLKLISNRLHKILIKVKNKTYLDIMREKTGQKDLTYDKITDFDEITFYQANLGDLSGVDNIVVQTLSEIYRTESERSRLEFEEITKTTQELYKKVLKKLKEKGEKIDDVFIRKENGYSSGELVTPISQKYKKERSEILRKSIAKLKKSKDDVKTLNDFLEWQNNNELFFDPYLLFTDEFLDNFEYEYEIERFENKKEIESKKEELISKLKSYLGEEVYNEFYDIAKKNFQRYIKDKQAAFYNIESKYENADGKIESEDEQKIEKDKDFWVRSNSPLSYLRSVKNAKSSKYPFYLYGWKYLESVPNKETNEKYYSKEFERINNTKEYRDFYNHYTKTMKNMYSFVPDYLKNNLSYTTLPLIEKEFSEKWESNSNVNTILDFARTKMYKAFTEKRKNPMSNKIVVEDEVRRQLPISFLPMTGEIQQKIDVAITDFKVKNNGFITREQYDNIVNKIKGEEYAKHSNNLGSILDGFVASALIYKNKSKVENQVRLINDIVMNSKVNTRDSFGKKLLNNGKILKLNTGQQLKEILEYNYDVFYGERKKFEMPIKKVYSNEELKEKKSLEEKIEKLKERFLNKEELQIDLVETIRIYQNRIDNLGSEVTGSAVGDAILQYVALKGIGWNVFSAVSNLGFGFISNLIHASGGEDFKLETYLKAQRMMLNNTLKSTGVYKNNIAKKISNLHDNYRVIKDYVDTNYDDNKTINILNKNKSILSGFEMQRRSEFFVQTPILLSLMLEYKIEGTDVNLLEAHDSDGNLKEEYKDKYTIKDRLKFKNKLDQVINSLHGNYDPNTPVKAKSYVIGRALLQFRSWMWEGWKSRTETEKYDKILGRHRKGRYRTLISYLADKKLGAFLELPLNILRIKSFDDILNNQNLKDGKTKYTKTDIANMKKNVTELSVYLSLIGVGLLLSAIKDASSDDEEAKKRKYIANFLINQVNRLQDDIMFYFNPVSFETITRNSIPAATLIIDIAQFVDASHRFMLGEDEIQSGYNAGQSRLLRESSQLFPLGTSFYRLYNSTRTEYK